MRRRDVKSGVHGKPEVNDRKEVGVGFIWQRHWQVLRSLKKKTGGIVACQSGLRLWNEWEAGAVRIWLSAVVLNYDKLTRRAQLLAFVYSSRVNISRDYKVPFRYAVFVCIRGRVYPWSHKACHCSGYEFHNSIHTL